MNELQESTQICEHLRTSAKFCEQQHGCEDAETQKHANGDMQQHGNTQIQIHMRKCGNAEMQNCITEAMDN